MRWVVVVAAVIGAFALGRHQRDRARAGATPATHATSASHVDPALAARAHQVVDRAVARSRWTADDRAELAAIMPRLGSAQAQGVLDALFAAINDGGLTVDVVGPPL